MTGASGLLFVVSTLEVGGSETKIVRIANALTSSGTNAEIAYLNPPDTLLGRIHAAVPTTHLERRGKYSLHTLRRLCRLTESGQHVVVAVNLYPLLYVIPAVKRLGPGRGRTVCLVNTVALQGRKRLLGEVYAPFLRRCDRLVFGCASQQKFWTDTFRLPAPRTSYIYNGVDHEAFSPSHPEATPGSLRRDLGIPDGAVVIGSVGRLAPEKSFDLLIRAVAELRSQGRDAWLVLVGQGPERTKLERLASRHGSSDRVRFLGVLDDVRPALAMMDVFVLPSSDVETFSNAALEAMSMARAVVLSDIGGAAEMLVHGESGLLFDVGDTGRLVELLAGLYDSSEMRGRLGHAARQRVLDRLRISRMVEQYRELLSD